MIIFGTLALGFFLGLVGAGGSGMTITLLSVGYGVPIHSALGVALAAMSFTMLSGTISHFREGDVDVKIGALVGGFGMVGAFLGSRVANSMPTKELTAFTAILLMSSAIVLYFQLFHKEMVQAFVAKHAAPTKSVKLLICGACIGIFNGFLSGAFGIGATAYIQIAIMLFFGVDLFHAIGTTMMIILPISVSGGLGYLLSGHLDFGIFVQTLCGLTAGAYVGAKFTRLIPATLLRCLIIGMPLTGGAILFFNR